MAPRLVLLAGYVCIFWLIARDIKRRPGLSKALWIPLLWVVILGSRPVSLWSGSPAEAIANVEDGSPMDRLVFQLLMAAGIVVLFKRRIELRRVISENKWLSVYFIYLGVSALWSDYPFISFKRWIKDLGNVIMVLVVLSEMDPAEAVKAMFVRCAYILVPLSVIFIKYFPDLGRYYNRWTWTYSYGGVTTDKNMLGLTLVVSGIFFLWHLLDIYNGGPFRGRWKTIVLYGVLLAMTLWLFNLANSATSQACFMVGGGILFILKVPAIRRKVWSLRGFSIPAAIVAVFLYSALNMQNAGTSALGRDMTFTGRTEIWQRVLSEKTNPLIGVGFYSFWLGDRVDKVSEGFYYHLNESHNGYIETYLNSGWIGIFLLAGVIVSATVRLVREAPRGSDYEAMQAAFLTVMVFYNVTEAAFDRMDILWVCFLLACVKYPIASSRHIEQQDGQPVSGSANSMTNDGFVVC
jgi:exopolysaccharide production protein ExoQ